jgi:ribosomal protein L12E/L44/L45/RPP1/RPP2
VQWCVLLTFALLTIQARAEDPKPTPANTITVQLAEPVKPQTFSRPLKFFLVDVIDRSGNAQPMLVFKARGGIFLDRTPAEITRAGLETCLKSANMLASDRDSADFLLTVYLFNFGLSDSSGMDFFGKVEFATTLKNPKTAKSQQVAASGTSIAGLAIRKKNIQKNVQEDIERAFADALRNLLRGVKLRDAVVALDLPADTPPAPAQTPAAAPAPAATEKPSATGLSNHLEIEGRKP